jgi:hypothetical protein
MASLSTFNIDTGIWLDHSVKSASGLVITLSNGGFTALSIGLGLMVTYMGSIFWGLLVAAYLRWRMRTATGPHGRRSLVDWEEMVALSTNGNFGTVLVFANMLWAWGRHGPRGSGPRTWSARRFLLIIFCASLVFAGFTIASVLVYRTECDSFRLSGEQAGFIYYDNTTQNGLTALQQSRIDNAFFSKTYAARCYGQDSRDCSSYKVNRLSYTAAYSPCPFFKDHPDDGICKAQTVQLNTGRLDSTLDLGINAPLSQRVQVQKRLTCSPIDTRAYETKTGEGIAFMMGAFANMPSTFVYEPPSAYGGIGYLVKSVPPTSWSVIR